MEPAPVLRGVIVGVAGIPVVSHLHLRVDGGKVHAVAAYLAKVTEGLAEGEQAFAPARV
jgi:predicted regulator of Ras-like GTPase activity (Roadblock/LC7/MglB family)